MKHPVITIMAKKVLLARNGIGFMLIINFIIVYYFHNNLLLPSGPGIKPVKENRYQEAIYFNHPYLDFHCLFQPAAGTGSAALD